MPWRSDSLSQSVLAAGGWVVLRNSAHKLPVCLVRHVGEEPLFVILALHGLRAEEIGWAQAPPLEDNCAVE